MDPSVRSLRTVLLVLCAALVLAAGCQAKSDDSTDDTPPLEQKVPHEGAWGIYALDLSTRDVELIWSGNDTITCRCLNHAGDRLAFSRNASGTPATDEEIFVIGVDGTGLRQLTDNSYPNLFPSYSPDDTRIAYLSMRSTMDIYVMDGAGGDQRLLYDSGFQDSDINWGGGGRIAFTRNSQIWTMKDDGSDARQVTSPPRAGQWGNANLPFGDYDPNFSPDGSRIAFERLEDDTISHGNYNLFVIDATGTGETRLTNTGYSQGLPTWSHAGDRLVYVVAAEGDRGAYDIHMIDASGANDQNITPDYFPSSFLCHSALFSRDDSQVYFTGQWYS